MSSLHADALGVLRAWVPPEAEGQAALRERYVAYLESHPDAMTRASRPDHLTASTLVLDVGRTHALLTLHAKAGRWFQLGGHAEPGDATLADAALREAVEESGLAPSDLELDPRPAWLDAHAVPFCGSGEGVTHLDVMYVAVARPGAVHAVSEESLDVRWWPLEELPNEELLPRVRRLQSTWLSNSEGSETFAASDQPSR
ncbi:NUDIX domain-containing protein [Nocardioides dongxiaopingii]|uniref:NUDIX hydrolase n=1 Tax=Nocardioides sp. S-1144 TaxID=2582905 RepID=UPI0011637DFE|nr:NUDIX domain-containing protein [Nocardioides sp. S-1144]QDH10816.1 NUDIX domain-containing protein [Nocardioides sp. S-1144]